MMNPSFESDYRHKILYVSFPEPTCIANTADVLAWRSHWTNALKSWHSPYKAMIDCSNLQVSASSDVTKSLNTMAAYLEGLFMRKAAGFGLNPGAGHELLPFPVFATQTEASQALGIRLDQQTAQPTSFRSQIHLENHFQHHVIEVSFHSETLIDSDDKWLTFKDKLFNQLRQWHSAWSMLIDCHNLLISPEQQTGFSKIERQLKGFFLKKTIGYNPKSPDAQYPFPVYRARHKAAAVLESEGLVSGEAANCASRKT